MPAYKCTASNEIFIDAAAFTDNVKTPLCLASADLKSQVLNDLIYHV